MNSNKAETDKVDTRRQTLTCTQSDMQTDRWTDNYNEMRLLIMLYTVLAAIKSLQDTIHSTHDSLATRCNVQGACPPIVDVNIGH